jgi:hypothetical protein
VVAYRRALLALHGEITLKNGRVEQSDFDTCEMLRIDEAPAIEVHIVQNFEPPAVSAKPGLHRSSHGRQRDLRRDREAPAQDACRPGFVERGLSEKASRSIVCR